MKLFTLAVLVTGLVAANPDKPIITMAGVSAKVALSAELKSALAPKIARLNAGLEKIVPAFRKHEKATPAERAKLHEQAQALHEECLRLLEEITAQMTPEQKEAFMKYLHEQLKSQGMDPSHFGGDHAGHHKGRIH